MPDRDPILIRPPARGRPADRIAAGLAAIGFIVSLIATAWFFLGFVENDPGFSAASSAFLLSLGLGAFAIIPTAIMTKLAWRAWRRGFQPHHGLWTIFFCAPWIALAILAARSDWLPVWLTLVPLLIGLPLLIWAVVSLGLERSARHPH